MAQLRQAAEQQAIDGLAPGPRGPDYWWLENLNLSKRAQAWSVVDPPDGRIPPLTPEARKRGAGPRAHQLHGRPVQRTRGSRLPRALHHAQHSGLDDPGHVRQQLSDRADAGLRGDHLRDHSRERASSRSTAVRTSARACACTWATRAATGKATRSSSRPPTSRKPRPIAAPTPRPSASSSDSGASRPTRFEWTATMEDPATWTQAVDDRDAAGARPAVAAAAVRVPRAQLRAGEHPQSGERGGEEDLQLPTRLTTSITPTTKYQLPTSNFQPLPIPRRPYVARKGRSDDGPCTP